MLESIVKIERDKKMNVAPINNSPSFESRKLLVKGPLGSRSYEYFNIEKAIRTSKAVTNFIKKGEPKNFLQKFFNLFKREEVLEAEIGRIPGNQYIAFNSYKKPLLKGISPTKNNIGTVYAFDTVKGENMPPYLSRQEVEQRLIKKFKKLKDIEKI